MKVIIFLLCYNFSVEVGRVCDISYYSIKEVKIKKIETFEKVNANINLRGRPWLS